MFTGIIEAIGKIVDLKKEGSNIHFTIQSPISPELKIDQSISHDGVCLTVIRTSDQTHVVTAVEETLDRSNLKNKKAGDELNLERSMIMNDRLDGHIVQGHVDTVARCKKIKDKDGSRIVTFEITSGKNVLIVEKGSIAINGVSLTIVKSSGKKFSVTLIPYTLDHTNLGQLQEGDEVNIEFDIIGKYVFKILANRKNSRR